MTVVALIYGLFLAYFITLHLSYLGLLAIGVGANLRRSREFRSTDLDRISSSSLTVPVSVLIPAYNDEHGVMDCIRSVLRSRFPEFEAIVIDDGSTDGTLGRLRSEFDLVPRMREWAGHVPTRRVERIYRSRKDPRLWVIEKENGGKADAANAGLNLAHYRYVVLTDADGVFEPDALARMIRLINFDPGRIVGLGATMRPLNGCEVRDGRILGCSLPDRWLERFQLLEYSSVFLGNRLGWSALNAVPVLSGGVSAWRKDTLREMEGFSTETTHEDLDTTLRLHRHFRRASQSYRIVYLPDTVVRTETPHTWRGFYAQRKRWQRTLFESVWRSRRMAFNPAYGTAGLLLLPHLLIYEALGPFVELASYVLTVVLLAAGVVESRLLIAFLVTAGGLTAITRLASLVIDLVFYERRSSGDVVRLSAAALLEYWIYRPFLLVARVHAFFEFLGGRRDHEKAERRADMPDSRSAVPTA